MKIHGTHRGVLLVEFRDVPWSSANSVLGSVHPVLDSQAGVGNEVAGIVGHQGDVQR